MLYQIALGLYKIVNENVESPSKSFVKLNDQIVCTNNGKIGMNCSVNKLYHLSKLIVLDKLNWSYPLFKKHMKIQFLKFGNT